MMNDKLNQENLFRQKETQSKDQNDYYEPRDNCYESEGHPYESGDHPSNSFNDSKLLNMFSLPFEFVKFYMSLN